MIASKSSPLFLVGCGNMAGQMLSRWLADGYAPSQVKVFRPSGRAVADGVAVITEPPKQLPTGATVLLGMKPYQLGDVAGWLGPILCADMTVISILAGTTLSDLRAMLPQAGTIVRAMPNLPVGIGEGVTALHVEDGASQDARRAVGLLMAPLGLVEWIDRESLFNEVTALSGCGPAFLFRFIDAMAQAGVAIGLPAEQAARMALATVQGSANMAARADVSAAILADRVASPGGMTREGLNVLDDHNHIVQLLTDTLAAARDRGEAMARGE